MARPFRYTFILIVVGLGACLAAAGGWRFARASAPVNGPIVLMSIDGLRADRLAAYGRTGVATPAIDGLARDGVVFERAYSHVPQTLPSHATIFSGRLPFETGVRDNAGFAVRGAERLLPEMLRDRAFTTGGVVSSFLLRRESGIDQGFSFFDGMQPVAGGPAPLRRSGIESARIAERWLGSAGTDRVFLFLHIDEPNAAVHADVQDVPGAYDASVAVADEVVARLVRYLKAHQLYDRSTILLLSDHGEGLGESEQGHGLSLGDEALHVPLIVKQPAGESAGRRVKDPVQLVDVAPTVLDFAKAPVPGNLSGRTLKPLLDGSSQPAGRIRYAESYYGAYHFGWPGSRSVTDGRYRYVEGDEAALYDVQADPAERRDVLAEHPDAARTLKSELAHFAATPLPRMAAVAPADRERFEALGWVGSHAAGTDSAEAAAEPADGAARAALVNRYRSAARAAAAGEWSEAIDRFRALVKAQPGNADLWRHLAAAALRAERHDLALEAFRQEAKLEPDDLTARTGAAMALLKLRKLDEARSEARSVATADANGDVQAEAREILARVALLKRNVEDARNEARLAEEADALRPVRAFIEGRIAFDQGRYAAAAESFDEALASIAKSKRSPIADLRLYAAESLLRLSRHSEAEYLFQQEMSEFPSSTRARTGLAAVYRATGRTDEAASLTH